MRHSFHCFIRLDSDAWIRQQAKTRSVFITGGPGTGKSLVKAIQYEAVRLVSSSICVLTAAIVTAAYTIHAVYM